MFKQLIEAICFRLIHGPLGGPASPEFQISRLELKPGDMLVLRTKQRLSMQAADCLRESFRKAAPGIRTLVIEDGSELAVLTAPAA